MNLKQLRYFVAIAEERQITAAAKRLNISQPPLSYELSQLEKELGVRLVERGPRGVTLTDAGRLLYERAQQILSLTSATQLEVASAGKGVAGTLSLGLDPSCAGVMPPERMLDLRSRYPKVSFELHDAPPRQVLDMLETSVVEVGVVRTPFKSEHLRCRFGRQERTVCVMPHDLEVGGDTTCTPEELAGSPLVVSRRIEPLVREAFSARGVTAQVVCVTDDERTAVVWARTGMGVCLVPESLIRVCDTADQYIKLVDAEELTSRPVVVWRADRKLSPLAERVVALLGELA